MVSGQTEVELKFLVPRETRKALASEMGRGSPSPERLALAARYLDTEDRRLARAGLAWRLRREGSRWIQTLKARGAGALERFEHEVIRRDERYDPAQHEGTEPGDRLLEILREARDDGLEVGVRFSTEVKRTQRTVSCDGALVEIAFDEGHLIVPDARLPLCEIEFELISGPVSGLLTLAEQWRERFGLIYDPRSKAERGDRLAEGSSYPVLRKAKRPSYPKDAEATDAFGAVLDECLGHVARNAIGLIDGDPELRVEHVHQLRVGIRRLRSALRSFRGWVPMPEDALVDKLRELFTVLGTTRDADVLDSGVGASLAKAGAPSVSLPAEVADQDPVEAVRATDTQRCLLAWISWRVSLSESGEDRGKGHGGNSSTGSGDEDEGLAEVGAPAGDAVSAESAATTADALKSNDEASHEDGASAEDAWSAGDAVTAHAAADQALPAAAHSSIRSDATGSENNRDFPAAARGRLGKWHRRIVADWKAFDELDEEALHSLRKRIKRQRYALEFFAPVLRQSKVERYLDVLTPIQDRMGELNDLFVARARYQKLVESQPAAWFALGWIAARLVEVRALAKHELRGLAKVKPNFFH